MKFQPRKGMLFLRQVTKGELQTSELWTGQEEHPVANLGEIIVAGPDVPDDLTPGTRVVFDHMLTQVIRFDGENMLLLDHEDVLAVYG